MIFSINFRFARTLVVLAFSVLSLAACNKDDPATPAPTTAEPAAPAAGFRHAYATVNGIKMHYVTGGQGPALVLLHGFGNNWYMWNRILPRLGARFTVIAPDLRGMGETDKPAAGYSKVNMAKDVHDLIRSLNLTTIHLAGHDIGMMVGYAYAATYPQEVQKLVVMDAIIPGVEPEWTAITTTNWWFGFHNKADSEKSIVGNERAYLTSFWPGVQYKPNAFTPDEVEEFVRAYSVPGAMRGSFEWFRAFPQDVRDNQPIFARKLTLPVLAMGGQYFSASFLPRHMGVVATNVTALTIPDAAHWLVQENPDAVAQGLLNFL